ncbi:hypothetical protein GCM10010505_01050 [Kitasatospora aburaviensis]
MIACASFSPERRISTTTMTSISMAAEMDKAMAAHTPSRVRRPLAGATVGTVRDLRSGDRGPGRGPTITPGTSHTRWVRGALRTVSLHTPGHRGTNGAHGPVGRGVDPFGGHPGPMLRTSDHDPPGSGALTS